MVFINEAIFLQKVYRIINKYNAITKKPRNYGLEAPLYSSEVHMLEVIGDNSGITTTQIAKEMAITKGAVSQTTARLLKKGLINKAPAANTSNTVMIFLTDQGKSAFYEHRKVHEQVMLKIEAILNSASQETHRDLEKILNLVDQSLNNY